MPLPLPTSASLPLAVEGHRYAVQLQAGPAAGLAPGLPLAFEPFLYLTPAHLALQHYPGEWLGFYLEDRRHASSVAVFYLAPDPTTGTGHSPWQAPFGGVQLAPGLPADVVDAFLQTIQQALQSRGLTRVRLRTPAFAYDPAGSALLAQGFTRLGYQVVLAELNNHLPLAAGLEARQHPSERRRLAKCRRHGFQFEQEPPLLLPAAYAFLRQCRAEKGQQLSLSLERLQELFRQFPRDYFLFSVRDSAGQWAALTIAIRVSREVLYNFYPASPLAYNAFSPVVLLNDGLCAFARANDMTLLDLGTSTLPDGPNHSLLQFKRHLGGVLSLKLTLEWTATAG